jgi:transposase InsO family protein
LKITQTYQDSHGTYGSPRITGELRERGEVVTAKTVAKIMVGVGGISPRTFKVKTTVVDPTASFPEDQVDRHFDRGRLDAVWLTDVMYLTCGEGDMFLCAIRDGHSHVAARGGGSCGKILHSDRGEFTASLTARACSGRGLRRSMGDTGICWDNSPAKSS